MPNEIIQCDLVFVGTNVNILFKALEFQNSSSSLFFVCFTNCVLCYIPVIEILVIRSYLLLQILGNMEYNQINVSSL